MRGHGEDVQRHLNSIGRRAKLCKEISGCIGIIRRVQGRVNRRNRSLSWWKRIVPVGGVIADRQGSIGMTEILRTIYLWFSSVRNAQLLGDAASAGPYNSMDPETPKYSVEVHMILEYMLTVKYHFNGERIFQFMRHHSSKPQFLLRTSSKQCQLLPLLVEPQPVSDGHHHSSSTKHLALENSHPLAYDSSPNMDSCH